MGVPFACDASALSAFFDPWESASTIRPSLVVSLPGSLDEIRLSPYSMRDSTRLPVANDDPARSAIDFADYRITPATLAFTSRRVEQEYQRFADARYLAWRRMALTLGVVIIVGMRSFDASYLDEYGSSLLGQLRLFLHAPLLLAILALTWVPAAVPRLWLWLVGAMLLIALTMVIVMMIAGPASYALVASIQAILFFFFWGWIPFRWAFPASLLVVVFFNVLALSKDGPTLAWFFYVPGSAVTMLVAAFGAYQVEFSARRLYVADRRLQAEKAAREAADEQRLEAMSAMTRFLRHELKNKIVAARSSLDLAERSQAAAQSLHHVARARNSVSQIKRLVDSVSDATSLEAALVTEEFDDLDLAALLREQVARFADVHSTVRLAYNGPDWFPIRGNELRLIQMLDNLLDNAVAHADPGSPVTVRLVPDGNMVRLEVEDIGQPLPRDRDQLFGLFRSMRDRTRKTAGNYGLGLYVVRQVAEAHGGKVSACDPVEGTGACFRVELPIVNKPAADA